ncbi:serine hydrolase domain-containing protein [Yokenella regensburgei]|uniref:serine hydrolase domain-containing protein n=1 Tax=Yokenella regensburgei TaxID=158877 RepID=UPI0028A04FD2|nr:serine hydrolase [Yokenella regensburgei]
MATCSPPDKVVLDSAIDQAIAALPPLPEGVIIAIGWAISSEQGVVVDEDIHFRGEALHYDGTKTAPDQQTLFKLASVSKLFTALAYSYALSDPDCQINEETTLQSLMTFSGAMAPALNSLSLLSLANYTSGLPADNVSSPPPGLHPDPTPNKIYSVDEMQRFLESTHFFVFPRGAFFHYSDLGFSLLGAAVARAYGMYNINDWMKAYLFDNTTMNMTASRYCPLPPDPWPANFPVGFEYIQAGKKYNKVQELYDGLFGAYYGGGGVMLPATEMMTWMKFNMGCLAPFPDTPQILARMQNTSTPVRTPNGRALGLGWLISQEQPLLAKNGDLPGVNTAIVISNSPQPGTVSSSVGVFVLINLSGAGDLATNIATQIFQTINQSPAIPPISGT